MRAMRFMETDEAGYRLYLGALEAPNGGGYTAALAVRRLDASDGAGLLHRDDGLACGYRFATADDALAFALRQARAWVRSQRPAGATPTEPPPGAAPATA